MLALAQRACMEALPMRHWAAEQDVLRHWAAEKDVLRGFAGTMARCDLI
jgi:hypothetical protein